MEVSERIVLAELVANGGLFTGFVLSLCGCFSLVTALIELLLSLLVSHLGEWIVSRSDPLLLHRMHFLFKFKVPLMNLEPYRHPLETENKDSTKEI